MMKRFAVPLTAVLIACLSVPEARASRGSGDVHSKEPLEYRQLKYLRSIDEKGAEYADRFSAMFVYLHREGGVSFSMSPVQAFKENPNARMLLAKGIATDAKVRDSVKMWLKLSASAITSDFDSLGTTEAKVLSRDAFSQALLSSPNFWQRMIEISRAENFDFRPVVHREIRAIQFTGNAVAWITVGGALGAAFRLLKFGRVAMIAVSVPAVAVTSVQLWDLAHTEDDQAPTPAALKSQIQNQEQAAEVDIKVLREHQRRLVILQTARDVNTALKQGTLSDLKRTNADLASNVALLKPMLVAYKAKLNADQLPIKAKDDTPAIRADIINSVDLLIKTADELSR